MEVRSQGIIRIKSCARIKKKSKIKKKVMFEINEKAALPISCNNFL